MADPSATSAKEDGPASETTPVLERTTYEVIRSRLSAHAQQLRERLDRLNQDRRSVFGAIETRLLSTQHIATANNCVPRDILAIEDRLLFGYNVHIGLRSETQLDDVFSIYSWRDGTFHTETLDWISDATFITEFRQLYKYYKAANFSRFFLRGPYVYMVFQVGKTHRDIKAFKWQMEKGQLRYIDGRSEHEVQYPSQHEFEWKRTHREDHRHGKHPHISIEDRLFVETIGGDLTIKIEDNTDLGEGIYREDVADRDQTLDDAEFHYALVDNIILLKIRPYQEDAYRYIVYNDKTRQARRLDAIERACVLLPEGHGLVFSNGYCLQTGYHKVFDTLANLMFERRIGAANGEDFLYVFYQPETSTLALMSYNLIAQRIESPQLCHGFTIFPNGHMVLFRADDEPQKHHALQIWQTPYGPAASPPPSTTGDSLLAKVGNKDLVRGMAECHEVLDLLEKDDTYANLYLDLVKWTTDILDTYFWLSDPAAHDVGGTLRAIREAATAAVDEFDKVARARRATQTAFQQVAVRVDEDTRRATNRRYESVDDYVQSLSALRTLRGEVIGLRDLRYSDGPAIDRLEQAIIEPLDRLSRGAIQFLLQPNSLQQYPQRVTQFTTRTEQLQRVSEANGLAKEIDQQAHELEMLIDVVGNLKIEDATQRTDVIERISSVYAQLNQARALCKKKRQELFRVEGTAEFASQIKLLDQALANYLDICDSPERCDDSQTKLMVQLEEVEARFAEFDDYVLQLAEKRDAICSAFDSKKVALVETRNRRAASIATAAERILQGMTTRVARLTTIHEIHGFFAADPMAEKVRDLVRQLQALQDTVKADDIQGRLKAVREDAIRQLKDRQELFEEGANVIRLGKHRFLTNTQELDATTVLKDGALHIHLTGTNYWEPIDDPTIIDARDIWDQELLSEDRFVYRAEYLAYSLYQETMARGDAAVHEIPQLEPAILLARVQQYAAPRHAEGYVRGVHDHDGALLLRHLCQLDQLLGLMRFPPAARGVAGMIRLLSASAPWKRDWENLLHKVKGYHRLFSDSGAQQELIREFTTWIQQTIGPDVPAAAAHASAAAEFLYACQAHVTRLPVSETAWSLQNDFREYVRSHDYWDRFEQYVHHLNGAGPGYQPAQFAQLRDWMAAFTRRSPANDLSAYIDEATVALLEDDGDERPRIRGTPICDIDGLLGEHPRLREHPYRLNYYEFLQRLGDFALHSVPRFQHFSEKKRQLVVRTREELRLTEFKPRVLTSFVRNQLIDSVYLPIIGDNLAKQIGVAGEQKRTDRMGMLLLISPPGYGKTTLMEYIANRLGLTFVKVNGPAIGHAVTSLDPSAAPNAGARQEIERLNLSLEMGDNVMIYLDDIQHCHAELLQKFISLCDAQRRIEGVFRGRSRTYDLRGRKVAVVMAGNPYTESGDKFQIPDMLANRADTFNLGDVAGAHRDVFELSYLENALTSNPTLAPLAARSAADVRTVVKLAENQAAEGVELEGNYSADELQEFVTVMRKLIRVRSVVLQVNRQYIQSAAQSDDYRTEPPFKLQGSYRDMNKIAERIVPVMNDAEIDQLVWAHYEYQAQTLTTAAEANLLKLREMLGTLSTDQQRRWQQIKETFQRNLLLGSAGGDDPLSRVMAQLSLVSQGLTQIQKAVTDGVEQLTRVSREPVPAVPSVATDDSAFPRDAHVAAVIEQLVTCNARLQDIDRSLSRVKGESASAASDTLPAPRVPQMHVIHKVPRVFLDVIRSQFAIMNTWMEPILQLSKQGVAEQQKLKKALDSTVVSYQQLVERLEQAARRE